MRLLRRFVTITTSLLLVAVSFVGTSVSVHANSSYKAVNGQFVWYSAPISDSSSELFTSDANGQNVRRVTTNTFQNGNPQWHPNGNRIIYDRPIPSLPGNSDDHSIYIINRDGTGEKLLVDSNFSGGYQSGYLYDPSFSPDGTKIAFHQTDPGNLSKIFVASYNYATNTVGTPTALGGNTVLNDSNSYKEPIWSKDGSKIVASIAAGGNTNVVVLNSTSGAEVWKSTSNNWNNSPQFGPQADKDLIVAVQSGALKVIDVTDTGNVQVDTLTAAGSVSNGTAPTWSPNGKMIAWGGASGVVHVYNYVTSELMQYQVAGYSNPMYEVDWTFGEFPDVSVECTTNVGESCTVDIPEFCQSELLTDPLNGTSSVADGKVTYTPNGNDADEENYVHLREDLLGNTAKCYVKIKFIPKSPDTGEESSNYTAPLIGAVLGVALTGGLVRKFKRR